MVPFRERGADVLNLLAIPILSLSTMVYPVPSSTIRSATGIAPYFVRD